jgi:hypothetical protein
MNYNPLSEVIDEPLLVSEQTVQQLSDLRKSEEFTDLPGTDITEERKRLSQVLNKLLDDLIAGVQSNASKFWVMNHFQAALEAGCYAERFFITREI